LRLLPVRLVSWGTSIDWDGAISATSPDVRFNHPKVENGFAPKPLLALTIRLLSQETEAPLSGNSRGPVLPKSTVCCDTKVSLGSSTDRRKHSRFFLTTVPHSHYCSDHKLKVFAQAHHVGEPCVSDTCPGKVLQREAVKEGGCKSATNGPLWKAGMESEAERSMPDPPMCGRMS
jgi:hypothetical protein